MAANLKEIVRNIINEQTYSKIYYRGVVDGSSKRIKTGNSFWDDNLFVSKDINSALCYGKHILIYKAKANAKITTESKMKLIQRNGENYLDYLCRCLAKAQKMGFDIIEFNRQGDVGTVIINKNSVELVKD